MIDIFLLKDKKLECKTHKQKIYEGENKFDYIYVNLSDYINEFDISELNAELRCYVDDEHYVSYELDTSKEMNKIDITYDLTDKPRYVKSLIILTKAGEVIGKTNFVSFSVDKSIEGSKLDPREDLDEIIDEQRAEIAEQAETISNQATEITEKDGRISELNGQVTELTSENTRLENLTDTQRDTIQNMLDNPPQPKLYTPPVITPSGNVQQIKPPTGYDGLNNAVVDRITAEVDPNIKPENIRENVVIVGVKGTYAPLGGVGGICINEVDEDGYPVDITVKNWDGKVGIDVTTTESPPYSFSFPIGGIAKARIKKLKFDNCKNLVTARQMFYQMNLADTFYFSGENCALGVSFCEKCSTIKKAVISCDSIYSSALRDCFSLEEIQLSNIKQIKVYAFRELYNLKKINLPSTLTDVDTNGLFFGNTLMEYVELGNGFNINNLQLQHSTLYSQDTIVSWLEALADRTGETAYTLTIGTTNINKLTAEQRAIATNKNWNLA